MKAVAFSPVIQRGDFMIYNIKLNARWLNIVLLYRIFFVTIFLLGGCLFSAYESFAEAKNSFMTPKSFSSLAKSASPAVVNIRAEKTVSGGGRVYRHFSKRPFGKDDPFNDFFERFFGEDPLKGHKQRSLGSGFIIDTDGYIVTNNHVVEDADNIKVKLKNEEEFEATVVGRDPKTDIALIKIKAKKDLPNLATGDSDELMVGQWVVAIGSPFGLEQTVTAGIVSAKGRVIGSGPYDDFIQTDASINPGNSGGPLLNMNGEVVGINTAIIAGGTGIGFAIPINLAKKIIGQLKKDGEVTRGWLGVAIQSLNGELKEYYGVENGAGALVTEIFPGDPADKAGIKVKDIIISVNGKAVKDSRALSSIIADVGVGENVNIVVLRNGKKKVFKANIAKRDDKKLAVTSSKKGHPSELGVQVSQLTVEKARRYNISETQGVFVDGVEPGSIGEQAGILHGDIIKEINHLKVLTVSEYMEAIQKIKKGESIQMFIKRINVGFIVIKITK
jgi:serine protease Do